MMRWNTQHENQITAMQKQQLEQADAFQQLKTELEHLKKQESNDVFNVDSIIGHKKQNRKHVFLIRWEGYDSSHDTWESETNLRCPQLLKNYKKANKLL